jgi:hypothetical protein
MKIRSLAFVAACATAIASLAPAVSSAQMSLPGFGSKAPASGPDASVQQDALVQSYAGANSQVMNANSKMAAALNLKDVAATSKATADAWTSSSTKASLSDNDKVTSEQSQLVSDELKKKAVMDKAAKLQFADGVATLASGVLKYVGMRKSVTDFSTALKSASVLSIPKLQAGVYVVGAFPTGMKTLGGSLQNAIAFSKSNDIPVPPDATKALSAL